LVGRQEGHPACKRYGDGGGGHWLVRMEWRPAGWSLSASVNLLLHHKVQKFSSGTGSPGWSRKKGRKTVVVWCGVVWCGLSCYNLNARELILIIFGRNTTEKASSQKLLYFPPHLTNASALAGKQETPKLHHFT